MTNFLVNVPEPQLFEAASSWLSRLALSQGISLTELMAFLHLDSRDRIHLDRDLRDARLSELRTLCKLPQTVLQVHERIACSLEKLDPERLVGFLNMSESKAIFRYCPACLREMRVPHVPIHWRFMAWRWCPMHDCLMEEVCHHCGRAQHSPVDLASADSGKSGFPWFSRCQHCSRSLGEAIPISARELSHAEHYVLQQGRAFLASMFHGHYRNGGSGAISDLVNLSSHVRLKTFSQELKFLSPAWRREWMSENGRTPRNFNLF